MEIFRYFIEDLKLSMAIYLPKPTTEQEFQYSIQARKAKDPNDKKEFIRFKNKLSRYNRIISLVIACSHQN